MVRRGEESPPRRRNAIQETLINNTVHTEKLNGLNDIKENEWFPQRVRYLDMLQ